MFNLASSTKEGKGETVGIIILDIFVRVTFEGRSRVI